MYISLCLGAFASLCTWNYPQKAKRNGGQTLNVLLDWSWPRDIGKDRARPRSGVLGPLIGWGKGRMWRSLLRELEAFHRVFVILVESLSNVIERQFHLLLVELKGRGEGRGDGVLQE